MGWVDGGVKRKRTHCAIVFGGGAQMLLFLFHLSLCVVAQVAMQDISTHALVWMVELGVGRGSLSRAEGIHIGSLFTHCAY